jgi:predicted nucleotidyltransferase
MRLSEEEIQFVRSLVSQACGKSSIWLFGSRVDDRKKGGDIDLYIETGVEIQMMKQLRLMSKLQRALGFRKIDLIIRTPNSEERSIFQTAKETGVRL